MTYLLIVANFPCYAWTSEQLHVKLLAAVVYTNPKNLNDEKNVYQ